MQPSWPVGVAVLTILASTLALGSDKDPSRPGRGSSDGAVREETEDALRMSPAVACRSINGYEDYEPLPDAALTSDEKLLIYYRPLDYQVEKLGASYHFHLTQDGQIRRRGEKAVLLFKAKLLDYDVKVKDSPGPIYLRNTVSLKGLKPGDYDFDIILHDEIGKGTTSRQTLPFRVVLPKSAEPQGDAEGLEK